MRDVTADVHLPNSFSVRLSKNLCGPSRFRVHNIDSIYSNSTLKTRILPDIHRQAKSHPTFCSNNWPSLRILLHFWWTIFRIFLLEQKFYSKKTFYCIFNGQFFGSARTLRFCSLEHPPPGGGICRCMGAGKDPLPPNRRIKLFFSGRRLFKALIQFMPPTLDRDLSRADPLPSGF